MHHNTTVSELHLKQTNKRKTLVSGFLSYTQSHLIQLYSCLEKSNSILFLSPSFLV